MDVMKPLVIGILESDDDLDDDVRMIANRRRRRENLLKVYKSILRRQPKKTDCFALINAYTLDEFRSEFRVSRRGFEQLLNAFAPKFITNVQSTGYGRTNYPLVKRLLVTLFILSKWTSFKDIAERFGIARSSAYKIFMDTCEFIAKLKSEYIKWPSNYYEAAGEFANSQLYAIPGTIGVLHEIEIPIIKVGARAWVSQKDKKTVKLQAICNSRSYFYDIYVGQSTDLHDSERIWRESDIYKKLTNPACDMEGNFHLIGCNAYPLDIFLLKPYTNDGLSLKHENFNKVLMSNLDCIKRAFQRLRNRFGRLSYLYMIKLEEMIQVVTAACVLHNFIITNDREDCEFTDREVCDNWPIMSSEYEEYFYNIYAEEKRNEVAERLPIID